MASPLAAFRHRDFAIFYSGQFVALMGSWMQTVASSWLVYRLTGSALLLGVTAAAQQLPLLFVSPVAGVWADRVDRRRLLVRMQSLAAAMALVLAALTFMDRVSIAALIAIVVVLGVISAFETPTRQALLLELVGRADLPNAIALQSMVFQCARFLGPTAAGVVLAAYGEGWCFVATACGYLAIVLACMVIRPQPHARPAGQDDWWRELTSGFAYAYGFAGTRRLLLLLAAMGFFSAPWLSLMPIFAAEVFHGNSRTLGILIGAVGFGALAGTAFLAMRTSVRGLGRVVAATSILAGSALALFALSRAWWLSLALLPLFGFGLVVTAAASNTILQTVADEDKRGRVISMYVMSFMGIAPLGNFAAGAAAQAFGAPVTTMTGGLLLALSGAVFALGLSEWARAVRPVYVRRGIIPEARD